MTRRWFLGVVGLWPFRGYVKDAGVVRIEPPVGAQSVWKISDEQACATTQQCVGGWHFFTIANLRNGSGCECKNR